MHAPLRHSSSSGLGIVYIKQFQLLDKPDGAHSSSIHSCPGHITAVTGIWAGTLNILCCACDCAAKVFVVNCGDHLSRFTLPCDACKTMYGSHTVLTSKLGAGRLLVFASKTLLALVHCVKCWCWNSGISMLDVATLTLGIISTGLHWLAVIMGHRLSMHGSAHARCMLPARIAGMLLRRVGSACGTAANKRADGPPMQWPAVRIAHGQTGSIRGWPL